MPRSTASRATIDTGSFVLNPDKTRPAHVSFIVSDERPRAYSHRSLRFCGRSPAYSFARHFRRAQPRVPITLAHDSSRDGRRRHVPIILTHDLSRDERRRRVPVTLTHD